MLFSNLLLSISILLSIVPTVLSGCRFSRFPLILRPRLGNWYIMRDLDETSPGFLRVEKDFEEQYIDGQSTVKHLFLSVKTNHDPHSRLTIFTRLFDIFTSARIKRYKIILRIHYAGGEPGDFGIIEIDVLKWAAFLANHTDVLYVVQAGWLGIAYGEWWGTPSTPDSDLGMDQFIAYKKSFIIDTLLQLPDNITISMRSPRDIANYFFGSNRVGFHNDCILSSGPTGTDTGTFDKGSRFWEVNNVKKSRAFARIQVKGLRGGEVCPGEYSSNMSCAVLLQYVKAYKLSYLNMEFPYRINEIIKSSDPSDVKCVKDITAALKYNG